MLRNLLIFFLLGLAASLKAQTSPCPPGLDQQYHQAWLSQSLGFEVPARANYMLYDTLVTWLGTPYRFAGNCEKGIDCSGFVNVVYDRVFGIRLGARNSGEIYHLVEKIDKDDLKEGDLVFFRIRHRSSISHVGVYLAERKFVHSSTSKGVVISDLDDPYYRKYFAGAGRHQVVVNRLAAEKE